MEVSSVQELCRYLISCAIQRCRMSDELCRLSVVLKSSPLSNPPLLRISISDTGVGSCLEEYQGLKYTSGPNSLEKWDGLIFIATTNGLIFIATTSMHENEIHQYNLNVKEIVSSRRLAKLPSKPKNGAKFSGTEVLLSTLETADGLVTCFLQKMLILKVPKLAIELVVDCGNSHGSRPENFVSANEGITFSSSPSSNIDSLKSGLEDYVFKHANSQKNICHSCFSSGRENLKVGSGLACRKENHRSTGQVMEAVIIISQLSEPTSPSCFRACGTKTEVLYFKDFSPCSISQSSLSALASIDWKSYGLILRSIGIQDGYASLEWENLTPYSHIDIVLHCYHKRVIIPPAKQRTEFDRSLTRKAIKLALDDLKENNAGVLLTAHALKIRGYAPDLATTIAGLVLSSSDSDFRKECFSLLGLQSQDMEREIVENCIKERIISVIELNDRKPQRSREHAPFLFEDERIPEPDDLAEEYEEDEEAFSSLDS
ncbi:unnamed protein product [Ilex paraguariensis]|uniref:Type 2 DNA topoisomerase 6 subunit B-like n=1 Tax=Ilex paraguariensis TaxID=185542 RepID=A0ABC8SQG1_9AQUA